MLLAIDVGNTTATVGIFKSDKLVFSDRIITKKPAGAKYYLTAFKKILKNKKIDNIIISSVVPEVTVVLKSIFRKNFGITPVILGQDLIVPIKNLYKDPAEVGQDRLVNAYAGYKKFGGGLIIIDFGTAITFDVVSKKGEYLGGVITPGIETSLIALAEKTALLPKIAPKRPSAVIGKDTAGSISSGMFYGFGAMCDGLVYRIRKETGKRYKVILTGGHSALISGYCSHDHILPNLTLEGLRLIHRLNNKKL